MGLQWNTRWLCEFGQDRVSHGNLCWTLGYKYPAVGWISPVTICVLISDHLKFCYIIVTPCVLQWVATDCNKFTTASLDMLPLVKSDVLLIAPDTHTARQCYRMWRMEEASSLHFWVITQARPTFIHCFSTCNAQRGRPFARHLTRLVASRYLADLSSECCLRCQCKGS
jgi:hypothetical protein